MKANGKPDRLRQLAVAFHKIAQKTPELKVDPPAARSLPTGPSQVRPMFRVRLRSTTGEAQSRMYVYDRGAKLETRVPASAGGDRKRSLTDDVSLDLRSGYRWQTEAYEDAAEMAAVMYRHMTDQLEAAASGD